MASNRFLVQRPAEAGLIGAPVKWSCGLKQDSDESVRHESHDKNKGDDDRRDKPVLHCIPSIIPARRGKSPRIRYEIGLSFEPWFGGLIKTRQRLGQARDAAARPCRSCRRCRRLSTPATAPASSPAVLPPPCSLREGRRECRSPCPCHHAGRWSLQAPRCWPRSSDGLTLLPPVNLLGQRESRSFGTLRGFQFRTEAHGEGMR